MTKPDRYHLPLYQPPKGFTQFTYLKNLCEKRLKNMMRESKTNRPNVYIKRLKAELTQLKYHGRCNAILMTYDLCRFARRNNIVYHASGSAISSIVSFLLGLSVIDPVKYDLPVKSFNGSGPLSASIKINFEDLKVSQIGHYLKEKYGTDNIAIPTSEYLDKNNQLAYSPMTGVFVIIDKPVQTCFPCLKQQGNNNLIPHHLGGVHKKGFFIFYLRGNRKLTIQAEIARKIHPGKNCKRILDKIPLNDSETYDLMRSQDTDVITHLNANKIKRLFGRRIYPCTFEELMTWMIFYHPGTTLMQFVLDAFITAIKDISSTPLSKNYIYKTTTSSTGGVIVFKDQAIKLLQKFTGINSSFSTTFLCNECFNIKKPNNSFRQLYYRIIEEKWHDNKSMLLCAKILFKEIGERYWNLREKYSIAESALFAYRMAYLKTHHKNEFYTTIDKLKGKKVLSS